MILASHVSRSTQSVTPPSASPKMSTKVSSSCLLHHSSNSSPTLQNTRAEARPEKDARASFYAAIKRLLSRDDIVIADGMNYIKGYRYQLFCEAKALMTPSCVVHIATPPEKCKEWNDAAILQNKQNLQEG